MNANKQSGNKILSQAIALGFESTDTWKFDTHFFVLSDPEWAIWHTPG